MATDQERYVCSVIGFHLIIFLCLFNHCTFSELFELLWHFCISFIFPACEWPCKYQYTFSISGASNIFFSKIMLLLLSLLENIFTAPLLRFPRSLITNQISFWCRCICWVISVVGLLHLINAPRSFGLRNYLTHSSNYIKYCLPFHEVIVR